MTRSITTLDTKQYLGFWIYLMTDCILFATLFATYAVLRGNTYGGPGGDELFDLPFVLVETFLLLTSSFVCGLALIAGRIHRTHVMLVLLGLVGLLGLGFLGMELYEFQHLVAEGNGWTRSGFLTSFFTLVGTHGAHILVGLLWLAVMMVRVLQQGLTPAHLRRLTLFSLFWHFLDVIWIFIFTIVYLNGAIT